MTANRFWTTTGIGYAIVAIAHVIFVGPFHTSVAAKRQEIKKISEKLDQYHRRGRTIVNAAWRRDAVQNLARLQGYDLEAKRFFEARHSAELPWTEWRNKTDATPAEFKLAYLSQQQKLSEMANELIQLPESGPLQSEGFEKPPEPARHVMLFQELWLQEELIKVLSKAEVTELIRIRIPGPDAQSQPPKPISEFSEIPFSLECRLPAASIPLLLNQLLQSNANISPDSLNITLASRKPNSAIMHLRITARSIPEVYLN